MATEPFPDFTPTERIGDPRCGSCPAPNTPPCAAPATWHVLWTTAPPAPLSLLCDKHMAQAQRSLAYVDRHPAAVICDIPGTGWLTGNPSRCVLTTTDDVAQLAAATEGAR
ncbi:hypothetical protein [Streptomyces microflavus]|uniref:hypothetical protein n=1 Tax=Streptomyces microflavus TaxID=1919 RepID=UPI002E352916|nr:hypothetical protein [Streptomyces microflavus]